MFQIKARGSTAGREVLGGVTTFMAMSYIIFVQVGLLGSKGQVGMDDGGVLMAVCISSGLACVLMGVWANYPIALAPGMGENFFFVGMVATMGAWGVGLGWQMALALTVVAGVLFLLLSTVGFRSHVLNAIPDSLKSGIAAGIGLLIARVGLDNANLLGVFAGSEQAALTVNPAAWVTLIGLAVTLALLAFRVRGAILIGILVGTGAAIAFGKATLQTPLALPSGLGATAGGFWPGLAGLWAARGSHATELVSLLFVLLFMDLFDTVGTLVGVSKRAGLMQGGRLPRAERALAADAAGTVLGGCLGSSTVTSFIESITGVSAGARTGLAAIVTGLCLLAAMFLGPLVNMVMGEFTVGGQAKFPTIAPALLVVGAMMLRAVKEVDWEDPTEYLPAFLTIIVMPLSLSISAGIAIGFVSYAAGKLITGRVKDCPIIVYVFAVLFAIQYIFAMPG